MMQLTSGKPVDSERRNADDGDADRKAQRAVQSVEVGGRLLLALGEGRGPMTLKALAAAARLPASRAHPYLVSFGRLGLVEQDPVSGLYALGPAALQLGLACLNQLDPVRAARPIAEALAETTGHAVALAVWGNFGPTVIRMIDARQPLHVSMRVGTVMSLQGTATGRAFAAVLPRERLLGGAYRPLGDAQPPAGTRRGVRDRAADASLEAALDEIVAEYRRHGVARAAGRPIPGVNAFSAVAFDHEAQPALVITALGHQDGFPSGWNSPMAAAVRDAAARITRRLGGPASPHGDGPG
jgi:DNA-binding IclR family transcriptional regulator